jgi:hypothetical protein
MACSGTALLYRTFCLATTRNKTVSIETSYMLTQNRCDVSLGIPVMAAERLNTPIYLFVCLFVCLFAHAIKQAMTPSATRHETKYHSNKSKQM